ncbi:hypothetical protein [Staphylococcus succinus]|uniref:Uncharacterized protein n=1 Tax=Staphylococcus succinus TaxID=61015 RepID=A0A9Q6MWQ8_9STAP|nr:hypothetical protein [Staphylococcus succinus]PTI77506.1 hypothetical protein BU058_00770 [Staphylococcus succinus]
MFNTVADTTILVSVGGVLGYICRFALTSIKDVSLEQKRHNDQLEILQRNQEQEWELFRKQKEKEIELLNQQKELDRKTTYFNNYFSVYSELYKQLQIVSRDVNMFYMWETALKESYPEIYKNNDFSEELLYNYKTQVNSYIRQDLNHKVFLQLLIDEVAELKMTYFANKILVQNMEQFLIDEFIGISQEFIELLREFPKELKSYRNEKDRENAHSNFYNRNKEEIEEKRKRLDDLLNQLENMFKGNFE